MKSTLGTARLFQWGYIVAIPLFGYVAESVGRRGSSNWTLWHWLVTGLALYTAFGGFRLRRRIMRRAEEVLVNDAANSKARRKWLAGQLIGFAFAESIALWGVVVRMVLGGTLWQASLFYATALLLLLLWTPRMPTKISDSI
jgi:hypothetical protein